MEFFKRHFSSKICFCGNVITLKRKMIKTKLFLELYEELPFPPFSKMKQNLTKCFGDACGGGCLSTKVVNELCRLPMKNKH